MSSASPFLEFHESPRSSSTDTPELLCRVTELELPKSCLRTCQDVARFARGARLRDPAIISYSEPFLLLPIVS